MGNDKFLRNARRRVKNSVSERLQKKFTGSTAVALARYFVVKLGNVKFLKNARRRVKDSVSERLQKKVHRFYSRSISHGYFVVKPQSQVGQQQISQERPQKSKGFNQREITQTLQERFTGSRGK